MSFRDLVFMSFLVVGAMKTVWVGPCVAVSRRLQHRTHLDKGYSPTDVLGWSPATDVLDVLYHVV